MKLILMADNYVGEKITNFLIKFYPSDLSLVVTTQINKIYQQAKKKGIPVCVFSEEGTVIKEVNEDIDLGILAWWPRILKDPLISFPRLGFINTHPSLLPYNRGKHTSFWALVEKAPFGVTLHCVNHGIDSGNIVAQSNLNYDWSDTGQTLYNKAQSAMIELFCKNYPFLRSKAFKTKLQDKHAGSYHHSSEINLASKITLDKLYLASDLLNLIRARTFEGYPGCWFETGNNKYEISIKIKKIN